MPSPAHAAEATDRQSVIARMWNDSRFVDRFNMPPVVSMIRLNQDLRKRVMKEDVLSPASRYL
jgi:hypothetical protein